MGSTTVWSRPVLTVFLITGLVVTAAIHAGAADAVEQMPDGMVENHGKGPPFQIPAGGNLRTQDSFRSPIEFAIVAKSNTGSIRIGYAQGGVLFGFVSKTNPNALRVELSSTGRLILPDKGRFPANTFATIRWVVTPTQLSIYLNGELRFQNSADYSAVNEKIFISGGSSLVTVQSLKTRQLAGGLVETPAPVHVTTPTTPPATPPASDHDVTTVRLSKEEARAVVLIKGDKAEGTGFLVRMPTGPAVVTGLRVISNNPNLVITTSKGEQLTPLGCRGATDRDLAMIAVKEGAFDYLEPASDVGATVQPGDRVIIPGNSEGGDVVLNTDGKVLGIGPDRVEFDNPIYEGNRGGPVIHVKSGRVIGVVTEAVKVDTSDELNQESFANRDSAIGHAMRYFGCRLDNVPGWETYDLRRFQNETEFLDQFARRSHCLDSFLNAPADDKPADVLWMQDDKILKADDGFLAQAAGADASEQRDALNVLLANIKDAAQADVPAIRSLNAFYSFDQQRAKEEMTYRQALISEIEAVGDNSGRLANLARKHD